MSKTSETFAMLVVTAGVIAALVFNRETQSYDRFIILNSLSLFWAPLAMLIIAFKIPPEQYGLAPCAEKTAWIWTGALFGCWAICAFYFSSWKLVQDFLPIFRSYNDFSACFEGYPQTNPWRKDASLMLYGYASYGSYLFCREFFFRGVFLSFVNKQISWPSVVIQALLYAAIFYNYPAPIIIAEFLAGIALGVLAIRTKSIMPGFVLCASAFALLDALAIANRPL